MSNLLVGQIFGQWIEPPGKKLVLLAFADAANSDGMTWMALESQRGKLDIRTKASMSMRAVQGHVATLEREGYLERNETIGKGCIWRVYATPANSAGVKGRTPANSAPPPANSAGEPLLNPQGIENTGEPIVRLAPPVDKCPLTHRVLPVGVTLEQWEAFLDMRASIGKAVKVYVANLVLRNLEAITKAGWHPGDVLDRSTVHAWPDVYPPEDGRVTGVRRVVAGQVAEPMGMSAGDRAEYVRVANIDDPTLARIERAKFWDRFNRRNEPSAIGSLVGELALRPPVKGKRT